MQATRCIYTRPRCVLYNNFNTLYYIVQCSMSLSTLTNIFYQIQYYYTMYYLLVYFHVILFTKYNPTCLPRLIYFIIHQLYVNSKCITKYFIVLLCYRDGGVYQCHSFHDSFFHIFFVQFNLNLVKQYCILYIWSL